MHILVEFHVWFKISFGKHIFDYKKLNSTFYSLKRIHNNYVSIITIF